MDTTHNSLYKDPNNDLYIYSDLKNLWNSPDHPSLPLHNSLIPTPPPPINPKLFNQRKRRLILETPFTSKSIISYGLIVYAIDTQRWALIQRKHSVEFLLFIRGLYRLTHLPLLLSSITSHESTIIKKCIDNGPSFFKDFYLNHLDLDPIGLKYSLIRLAESRTIVTKLLSNIDLTQNQLQWTWPKGRLHISFDNTITRETPFDCAKREFSEEVEITLPPPLFISDTYVSENIQTFTGRNIESRYWIYVISNEIPMSHPSSNPEVSNQIGRASCRERV